jgi:acyl carrier protein
MSEEEFRAALEKMLEMRPGSITAGQALDEIASWDSMAALEVIALADQKLGTVLSAEALMECRTVKELTDLVLRGS